MDSHREGSVGGDMKAAVDEHVHSAPAPHRRVWTSSGPAVFRYGNVLSDNVIAAVTGGLPITRI